MRSLNSVVMLFAFAYVACALPYAPRLEARGTGSSTQNVPNEDHPHFINCKDVEPALFDRDKTPIHEAKYGGEDFHRIGFTTTFKNEPAHIYIIIPHTETADTLLSQQASEESMPHTRVIKYKKKVLPIVAYGIDTRFRYNRHMYFFVTKPFPTHYRGPYYVEHWDLSYPDYWMTGDVMHWYGKIWKSETVKPGRVVELQQHELQQHES